MKKINMAFYKKNPNLHLNKNSRKKSTKKKMSNSADLNFKYIIKIRLISKNVSIYNIYFFIYHNINNKLN